MQGLTHYFKKMLLLGVEDTYTFNEKRNIQITNGITVIVLGINIIFLFPLLWLTNTNKIIESLFINLLTFLPACIILLLSKKKRHLFARYLLFVFFLLFLGLIPLITQENSGTHLQIIVIMSATVLLFEHFQTRILFFLLAGTFFILIINLGDDLASMLGRPLDLDRKGRWINTISMILLMFFILQAFKSESQQYQQTIENTNQELSNKNQLINESIRYAQRIQKAILPDLTEFQEEFQESFILYQPKNVVSGDFYWHHQLPHGWLVAIGDCTGHGVPGALMSMLGVSFLEQIVVEKNITQPSAILEQLDELIRKTLRQEQTENHDGLDIALCLIDQKQSQIIFSGANNPLWLVRNKNLEVYKGTRRGIGGIIFRNRHRSFEQHTIAYDTTQKTTLYMMSDGYQDQFGGKKDRRFTTGRLKELLVNQHHQAAAQQQETLTQTLQKWIADAEETQTDDISILGITI